MSDNQDIKVLTKCDESNGTSTSESSNGENYLLLLPIFKPDLSQSTNTSLLLKSASLQQKRFSVNGGQVVGSHVSDNSIRTSRTIMNSSKTPSIKKTDSLQQKLTPIPRSLSCRNIKHRLCGNCGVPSTDPVICHSCKKSVTKTISRPLSIKSSLSTQGRITKSSYFYGNSGLSEFSKYLEHPRRPLRIQKARKTIPKVSSECITISDSSDEECTLEIVSVASEKDSQCESSPLSAAFDRSTDEVPVKIIRVDSLVPKNDNSSYPSTLAPSSGDKILNIAIRLLRIGQMKLVPTTHLQVSDADLAICLHNNIFRLKWFSIKSLELSPVQNNPCLYVFVKNTCLGSLRSSFEMVPGKTPYFNPDGPADQRHIIFFLDKSWFINNEEVLRRRLRHLCMALRQPQSFFQEITVRESQCRLQEVDDEGIILENSCPHATGNVIQTRSKQPRVRSPSNDVEVKACFNEARVELAIYPPPPATGGISISNADVFCLNDGEFLNDVIIDFYLKYLMEEILSEADKKRSHVFSSFFYARLTQTKREKNQDKKEISLAERRHARVHKWTRGVDIFSKDFIFVPVNDSSHWFLALICFPGKFLDPGRSESVNLSVSNVRSVSSVTDDSNHSNNDESKESSDTSADVLSVSSDDKDPNLNTASHFTDNKLDTDVTNIQLFENKPMKDLTNDELSSNLTDNNLEVSNDVEMRDVESQNNVDVTTPSPPAENNSITIDNEMKGQSDFLSSSPPPNGNPVHVRITSKQPCILIFDSLRTVSRSKTSSVLREYLTEEWKSRKSRDEGERIFDTSNLKMCSPVVPQQDNYSDCGLFLLHYVEKIFESPIPDYNLPIKSLSNWFDPNEVKQKRKNIKDVIEKLRVAQSS